MTIDSTQNEFGYFGKLPTFGDFIHQVLPQDFANCIHEWVQRSMADAREELGDDFLTYYLNCPAWKFLMTSDVCGIQAVAGLTIPSVDKVGRYFNFTLATVLPPETNAVAYGLANRPGFRALEQLALDLLEQDLPREIVDLRVREAALEFNAVPAARETIQTQQDHVRVCLDTPLPFVDQASALLADLLRQKFGTYSVWWHGQEGQAHSNMVVCRGMPSTEVYMSLLTSEAGPEAPQEEAGEDAAYIDKIIAGEI